MAPRAARLPRALLLLQSPLSAPNRLPAHTRSRARRKWLLFVGGLLISLAAYLLVLLPLSGNAHLHNPSIALFGALTGVALAAAPLATVREVLRTKDASSFPGTLVLMQFLQFLSWTIYGWVVTDWSTFANNLVGVVLGGLQLCLMAYFGAPCSALPSAAAARPLFNTPTPPSPSCAGNKRNAASASASSASSASALDSEKGSLVEGKEGKH